MITIVIPLYNKAHTIVKTLDSVLKQSFTQFEVILVNDGSTDNSIHVVEENFSDGRIRIINQSNQGVSVARNVGVEYANYEYIAFLDGDDEWLPEYLSTIMKAIYLYPNAGMFCCAGKIVSPKHDEVTRLAKKYAGKIIEIDFFENPHVFLHTSATVVTKTAFNKTNGFPVGIKRNEDYALFLSLALLTPVVYCGFLLSIYSGGVQGQATSNHNPLIYLHKAKRYNIVHTNWLNTGRSNKTYPIFTKYEMRHMFKVCISQDKREELSILFRNLSPDTLNLFKKFELFLYKNREFKYIAILFILGTKVKWKMRGYPSV